jgi:hypothetical protein
LSADGVLTLPNFLGGGQEISFTITGDKGSKDVKANFAQGEIPINITLDGTKYTKIKTYVDTDGYEAAYLEEEDADCIELDCYVYDEAGNSEWTSLYIVVPDDASGIIDQIVGSYTGTSSGYEYLSVGSLTETSAQFDGTTNKYVKIEAGENLNEVLVSNLIPTGYSWIKEPAANKLTGYVEKSDYEGYVATITIQPVDYCVVNYPYSGVLYPYSVRLSAAWTNSWTQGPTEPVVLGVKDDYSIFTAWTGQELWLDWNGDGSTWYVGYYDGYGDALLTKVDEGGVNDITVDNSNAPVEFFNLNGVRLNGDNLAPGLYIRRQGTQASKVVVK